MFTLTVLSVKTMKYLQHTANPLQSQPKLNAATIAILRETTARNREAQLMFVAKRLAITVISHLEKEAECALGKTTEYYF